MDEWVVEPWVVLIHDDYEKLITDYLKNPDRSFFGPMIFHIEPRSRYQRYPPTNKEWRFLKMVANDAVAFDYIDSQERKLIQEVVDKITHYDGSLSNRYKILKRDNFHCCLCGRGTEDGVKLEVDHKTPRSLGGSDTADNLWTLCFDCNRGKSNRDVNG